MSVKSCEKLDKSKVALTIEADAAAFEAAINKAYLKQRGKISVPGFRPGKAPRKMIESMYGAEVFYEEAVNILLPDAYEDAVKEQELKVVGYPQVELESCGKDGVVFKCTVAVYPEVTLGQYKGLEAPKAEVNVTDEDVENRLNEMADRNSRLVSVEREIQKGDTADIDFEGFDNGVPFDGGKGENFDLEIGSGSFVPGFEDQLVGMKAGEEKDIDITFPENYTPELAGKPVVFHVKVNEVKHKEVPAIDDEFAKDVSEFDTLEELKADTRKKLTDDREAAAQRAFEDALMQKVADGIQADIPDEMVDVQAQQMMENFQQQLAAQGIPFDQYLKMTNTTEDDFKKQAHDPAVQQVRMDLAVAALVKAENLEATAQEIEDELKTVADKYGMDLDTIKKYLPEADVREQVLRSKAIKAVADAAVAVAPVVEESQEEAKQEEEKKDAAEAKRAPRGGITRRGLFIGVGSTVALLGLGGLRYAGHNPLNRPPGGADEAHLVSGCIRCERCYEACPRQAIVPAKIEDGLLGMRSPMLDFNTGNYCDFCYEENGRLVVTSSTQIPHIIRRVVGQALGRPWGDIRVVKPYIGGGFGNKQDALYEPLCAWCSTQVNGRCVRIDCSREETFVSNRVRHAIRFHIVSWLQIGRAHV